MRDYFQIFVSRKMFLMLLLGFSSGLPLALTAGTLHAWLRAENLDLSLIGTFALVGMPYSLKFMWAPLMDRFSPGFLGRRRGWMLIAQTSLIVAIASLGFLEPQLQLQQMAFVSVLIAFLSASQDIAIDAYRTEVLEEPERGLGAAITILGYRIAMLTSGALALILSDTLPWKSVYTIMAATMLIGVFGTFIARESDGNAAMAPRSLRAAVVDPLREFLKRPAALEMLAFVLLYKIGDVLAAVLTTPFMMDLGFSRSAIGEVTKGVGLLATIIGTMLGGALMVRIPLKRALILFGISQAIATLSFAALAALGNSILMMAIAISLENFCAGLGTAAFTAFLMALCNKQYTATQYALLTSLMSVTRNVAGAPTGYIVENIGWLLFFICCSFAALPGLMLLSRFDRWGIIEKRQS